MYLAQYRNDPPLSGRKSFWSTRAHQLCIFFTTLAGIGLKQEEGRQIYEYTYIYRAVASSFEVVRPEGVV